MEGSVERETNERRQRKKKLINEVKELLEFYFSPANLKKDTFMNKLLEEDGYIDIEIFHKFNKIKNLTSSTPLLRKAVKNSEILELSEDENRVKRKLPVQMKDNEMECTIYVENLPPNATHEWVKKVFSNYGVIDYISLPRFQITGLPKGFAFVEFQTPEESQQALLAFGGLASLDGTLNPNELLSIKSYGKDMNYSTDAGETSYNMIEENEFDRSKKRVAEEETESDNEGVCKKIKGEFNSDLNADDFDKPVGSPKGKKKKKRKRSKKEKEYELDSVYLRVMSKQTWKSLRNKYLDSQKEHMKLLKNSFTNYDIGTYYSKSIHEQYRKNPKNLKDNVIDTSTRPEYIPNVIVKITLEEPPKDIREFRQGIQNNRTSVAYVDIREGDPTIHVRFKTAEGSTNFLEEGLYSKVQLLSGDEESCYWSRIFTLWELRNIKRKKKNVEIPSYPNLPRGRDKLVNKALKHSDRPFKKKASHVIFND